MKGFNRQKPAKDSKVKSSITSQRAAMISGGSRTQSKLIWDFYQNMVDEFDAYVGRIKGGSGGSGVKYVSDSFDGHRGRDHSLEITKGKKTLRLNIHFTGASAGNPGGIWITTDENPANTRWFKDIAGAIADIQTGR